MAGVFVAAAVFLCCALTVSAVNFERTIVAISKETAFGQNIFLRGESSRGNISIRHELKTLDSYGFYAMLSTGDRYLSWDGAEPDQWKYQAYYEARGTPMMHSTNDHTMDENVNGTSLLSHIGDNLWIADFYMDCDQTDDGWFQFKGYIADLYQRQDMPDRWERDVSTFSCNVDGVDSYVPEGNTNHNAKCGYFNLAIWDNDFCWSQKLDYNMMQFRYAWQETVIN